MIKRVAFVLAGTLLGLWLVWTAFGFAALVKGYKWGEKLALIFTVGVVLYGVACWVLRND